MLLLFLVFTLKIILSYVVLEHYHHRNIIVYNWGYLISYCIVSAIYYHVFKGKQLKWGVLIGSGIALLASFYHHDLLLNPRTTDINTLSQVVWGFFILVFVGIYFYNLLKDLDAPNLLLSPLFWLSAGFMVYFSGTILSYIYSQTTFNSHDYNIRREYWIIEFVFSIVLNCFLSVSIWCMKQSAK